MEKVGNVMQITKLGHTVANLENSKFIDIIMRLRTNLCCELDSIFVSFPVHTDTKNPCNY